MAFHPLFFHHHRPIIGGEVMEAVQMVFESKDILYEWKETLITLIPKKLDVSAPGLCEPFFIMCVQGFWLVV